MWGIEHAEDSSEVVLTHTTATVVERAIRGDQAALAELVREATPGLYRYALRMTQSEEEAMDTVQETFLRALKNLHRFDPAFSFNTWIYRIARNLCIDRARHRSRWASRAAMADDEGTGVDILPDATQDPLADLVSKERRADIERAIARLPPIYREVIIMYHFEEMSYQQIADILNVPMGTVMNRIFRARKKLKGALGETLSRHPG